MCLFRNRKREKKALSKKIENVGSGEFLSKERHAVSLERKMRFILGTPMGTNGRKSIREEEKDQLPVGNSSPSKKEECEAPFRKGQSGELGVEKLLKRGKKKKRETEGVFCSRKSNLLLRGKNDEGRGRRN